ncbi:glycosyltransferase [Planococcus sp. SE5232]|uniref:glycosyltransferase n=1 Tax=unclassified Planococcus (in: firmicutes) TaxID=2662419 RepID=UPI003D6C5CEF
MKVLFIGSVLKNEDANKHRGISVAGNKMQMGIIKALYKKYQDDLSIITSYPIASFPTESKIIIKNEIIELAENIYSRKVPFINIFLLKQYSKIINTYKYIKNWMKENNGEEKMIICYNAFPHISLPILWATKYSKVKTICLVADLPIDGVVKFKNIKGIAAKIESESTKKNIKKFDLLAVLNESAARKFSPTSQYVVIDGGFDLDETPLIPCGGQWLDSENEKLRVMFSGLLTEYNGIQNLIEAAKLVKNNKFILDIYGDGPLTDYVREASIKNPKINYMGRVSNSEIMKLQHTSSLLISTLDPEHPVAKVAFPSKIVEYLVSGTPVLSSKVNSLSSSYLKHMYVFNDMKPDNIAKEIDIILSKDKSDLIEISSNARKFILDNKNWEVQVDKIISAVK